MNEKVKRILKKMVFFRYLYHLPGDIVLSARWYGKRRFLKRRFDVRCFNALKAFKDIHKGERCFIIGNGPSLLASDLDRLENEITFASNSIFHIFGQTKWRPTYFCTGDPNFPQKAGSDVCIPADSSRAAFFNYMNLDIYSRYAPAVLEKTNVYFYYHAPVLGAAVISREAFRGGLPRFGSDLSKKIYSAGTISYEMLQIAAYMGFSEIDLIGIDHSYPFAAGRYFYGADDTAPSHTVDCANWTFAYEAAQAYAGRKGLLIQNATRGGHLEVFPRVDFDKLFENNGGYGV